MNNIIISKRIDILFGILIQTRMKPIVFLISLLSLGACDKTVLLRQDTKNDFPHQNQRTKDNNKPQTSQVQQILNVEIPKTSIPQKMVAKQQQFYQFYRKIFNFGLQLDRFRIRFLRDKIFMEKKSREQEMMLKALILDAQKFQRHVQRLKRQIVKSIKIQTQIKVLFIIWIKTIVSQSQNLVIEIQRYLQNFQQQKKTNTSLAFNSQKIANMGNQLKTLYDSFYQQMQKYQKQLTTHYISFLTLLQSKIITLDLINLFIKFIDNMKEQLKKWVQKVAQSEVLTKLQKKRLLWLETYTFALLSQFKKDLSHKQPSKEKHQSKKVLKNQSMRQKFLPLTQNSSSLQLLKQMNSYYNMSQIFDLTYNHTSKEFQTLMMKLFYVLICLRNEQILLYQTFLSPFENKQLKKKQYQKIRQSLKKIQQIFQQLLKRIITYILQQKEKNILIRILLSEEGIQSKLLSTCQEMLSNTFEVTKKIYKKIKQQYQTQKYTFELIIKDYACKQIQKQKYCKLIMKMKFYFQTCVLELLLMLMRFKIIFFSMVNRQISLTLNELSGLNRQENTFKGENIKSKNKKQFCQCQNLFSSLQPKMVKLQYFLNNIYRQQQNANGNIAANTTIFSFSQKASQDFTQRQVFYV